MPISWNNPLISHSFIKSQIGKCTGMLERFRSGMPVFSVKIIGSWADGVSGLCAEFLHRLIFGRADGEAVKPERIAGISLTMEFIPGILESEMMLGEVR